MIKNKKITITLGLVAEAVGENPAQVPAEAILTSIGNAFPGMKEEHIIQAMKNGMYGMYGRTWKLTPQEVCIWIRKHYETTPEYKQELKQKQADRM